MKLLKHFIFFYLIFSTSLSFAQDRVNLPEGVPSLEEQNRFLISKDNATAYKDILVSEMFEWIIKDRFLLFVSAGLNFKFSNVVPSESRSSASELLEEVASATRVSSNLHYLFNYEMFNRKGLLSSNKAEFFRSFVFSETKTVADSEVGEVDLLRPIFFREVFLLSEPENLKGYFLKTVRFASALQDEVLFFSPLLKEKRKLFEVNREDKILSGILSINDLLVYSEKPEKFTPRIVSENVVLVPFYSLDVAEVRKQADGSEDVVSTLSRGSSMLLWNYQTLQFERAAPWLPTTAQFVPRETISIELVSSDVFSEVSKIILIIDKESRLPIYKFVYDQKGDLDKIVIGIWAKAESETNSFPFQAGLIAVSGKGAKADILSATSVSLEEEIPTEIEKLLLEE